MDAVPFIDKAVQQIVQIVRHQISPAARLGGAEEGTAPDGDIGVGPSVFSQASRAAAKAVPALVVLKVKYKLGCVLSVTLFSSLQAAATLIPAPSRASSMRPGNSSSTASLASPCSSKSPETQTVLKTFWFAA
ncbi:hypothetical protein DESA109040_12005 [Deinococcus saxicola]